MTAWLYEVDIAHLRLEPVRHEVRRHSYQWFVDIDELPRLPRGLGALARFKSSDHLGDPARSIRANVDAFLAQHGIDLHGGRVTMLTNARTLGYTFNPLTLFWCHDADGAPVCVIAEVHNTYGQSHSYLLRPDGVGRAQVQKAFYVSPFYPVEGYYRMRVPEPDAGLSLAITMHRPGARPFTATVRGVRRPATFASIARASVRRPVEPLAVRALIVKHGITLWRKGLPIMPRSGQKETARAAAGARAQ